MTALGLLWSSLCYHTSKAKLILEMRAQKPLKNILPDIIKYGNDTRTIDKRSRKRFKTAPAYK